MIRFFQNHKKREQLELDGLWEFTPVEEFLNFPDEYQYRLPVPSCWEQQCDLLTYRGKGVYRKITYVRKEGPIRLVFKGVSHTADLYFDGEKIAHHYNAYTQFDVVIKDVKAGEHEIILLVDNSFSAESTLHFENDYNTYGGIIRPVIQQYVHNAYLERVEFTPEKVGEEWKGYIKVFIKKISDREMTLSLKGTLGTHHFDFGEITIRDPQCIVEKEVFFSNIKEWSHETPNLYMLEMQLCENEEIVDDLIERVGFRTVSTINGKIYLNGREIFIKGFNRHEDHATFGASIPVQLMVKDIEAMKDMGANAVRTSHYPNDERFLDLCDEIGLLVWEENHARAVPMEVMIKPEFDKQCEDCNREMVQNHYNHPSIIIWGILNECASDEEAGRYQYKKQLEYIKSMDKSRLNTFATCRHFSDICLDLPDIVSFNMYSKWYGNNDVKKQYDEVEKWILESGGQGKPIIVSEFGAAAIYGFREPSRVKWSEERQADIVKEAIEIYSRQEKVCGIFIWQYCDCRVTTEGKWVMTRARNKNNKGIVDEYRRPKLAYEAVKNAFTKIRL